jgi:hypothetical protein
LSRGARILHVDDKTSPPLNAELRQKALSAFIGG